MLRKEEEQDKNISIILLQTILSYKYFHNKGFSEQNVASLYSDYLKDFPSSYYFSFFSNSGGILASATPFSNNFPRSAVHLMKNLLLLFWILMQTSFIYCSCLEETPNSWALATLLCATSEQETYTILLASHLFSGLQTDNLHGAHSSGQAFPSFAHSSPCVLHSHWI